MRALPLVILGLFGCEKTKEPVFEGPLPIAFGDCAGANVAWVSGPRPGPFKPEDAEVQVADATASPPPPAPAAPSEPPPPPSASALARQQAIEQARAAGIIGTTALQQGGAFASLTGTGGLGSAGDITGGLVGDDANGGFGYGRSGFGLGGGSGTGWGTIGTGRYGTIGHGHPGLPTVSIGQPSAEGALDKAIIRRYIKRNVQKITYCYERQLLAKPKLAGTVTAKFAISHNGTVVSSTATGVDVEVASCVAGVIKDIEFPKPKDPAVVQVTYPFTFRPVADSAPAAAPVGAGAGGGSAAVAAAGSATPSDAGSGSGSGSAAGSATPPVAGSGSGSATGRVRALFGPTSSWVPNYVPGAANPLRKEGAALTECLRRGPQHAGVMIVDLVYGAGGKVTTASTEGVADEATRACIAEIAQRAQRVGDGPAAQRCSLAYGQLAVADLPGVDITADAVTFAGRTLAQPKLVMADDDRATTIPELVTAVAAGAKAAIAANAVAIHGPLAIRAIDATPMRVVDRVLASVVAGGDDPVLAIRRGAAWETLPAMALPVVPVPFSTGDRWTRVKPLAPAGRAIQDDERVVLSLLVTTKQIWVGMSRVSEFVELVPGPAQLDKLLLALKEKKAGAFFIDRTDLEIAGDDTVTYGEVAKVIDAAATAGFVDWQITEPAHLKARPAL